MRQLLLVSSVVAVMANVVSAEPITRYVVVGGAGAKSGTSWADAYSSVKTAYDEVGANAEGGEVWVAKGVYGKKQNDKTYIIQLKSNVTVRGGFAGGETSAAQADPTNNVTIFTSDIVGPYDDWRMDATEGTPSGVKVREGDTINFPPADRFPEVRAWVNHAADGYHCTGFGISSGQVTNCAFRGIAFVSFMQRAIGLLGTASSREEVSSLTVEDCLFVACGAMTANGGNACIGAENTDLQVRNCRFVGSANGVSAGASVGVSCRVSDCSFEWCGKARGTQYAGCVDVRGGVEAVLSNLTFDKCFFRDSYDSTRAASCVSLGDTASSFVAVVSNCVFAGCYMSNTNKYKHNAQSYGVLHVHRAANSRTEIVGCDFVGNTNLSYVTSQYGLSACIADCPAGSTTRLIVKGCSFRNNCLTDAGANGFGSASVYSVASSGACPVFLNCTIVSNVCSSAVTDTGKRVGRTFSCNSSCPQAVVNCIFLGNDSFVNGTRVPEMANGDQTWGFYNTIMWHGAADYSPFPSSYISGSFTVVQCDFWHSPLTPTYPASMGAYGCRWGLTVDVDPELEVPLVGRAASEARHLRVSPASPFRRAACKIWRATNGDYYFYDEHRTVNSRWRPVHDQRTFLTDAAAADLGLTLEATPIPDAFGDARTNHKGTAYGPLDAKTLGMLLLVQ